MQMRPYHFLIIIIIFTSTIHLPISFGNEMQITPSLGLQAEYNDNIFFSDTDELDDYIVTLSPQLKYTQDSSRLNLELGGRLDSIRYADNDELNDIDQNLSTIIRYRLDPRWTVFGEFDYFKDSRPDRDIETTGLLLSSNIRYSRFFTLSQSYDHSENTVSLLTYTFENQDFEDPELADFDTHLARLTVSHNIQRLVPMTLARFNFGYDRYEYPELTVNSYSTTLGASHNITELFTLVVDLGASYTRKRFENGTAPAAATDDSETESGFIGQLSLNYQGETTKSLLSVSHELRAASGRNAVTERTSLVFDLSRRLTSELRSSFKARYYINQADQGDLATEDIDTRTLSIIPGIRYQITNDIFIEMFYNYSNIEDRQDDTDADRHLVFLRLVGQYPIFK